MTQPLIPPEPWYASPVFVSGAIAVLGQVLSIVFRFIGYFVELDGALIEKMIADILQVAAIGFGVASAIYRYRSKAAPLALTAEQAAKKAAENPALLPAQK